MQSAVINPVSVRERAKRIDTNAEENNTANGNAARPSRYLHAIVYDRDRSGSDTQSAGTVSSMTVIEREWLHASLAADYHRMCALLRKQPSLASFRDYVTGSTALHRTVMNPDCVKLLVGSYKSNIDARSYSGATVLHVFAQKFAGSNRSYFDEDAVIGICELLVRTYSANVSIRDYSGRQALHYLPFDTPKRVREMLSPARLDAQLTPSVYTALFGLATTGVEYRQTQPQPAPVTFNARLRSAFIFRQRASHNEMPPPNATLTPPKSNRNWLPPSITNAVRGVTRHAAAFGSVSDEPLQQSQDANAADTQLNRGLVRRSISADCRSQPQSGSDVCDRALYESGV